MSRLVILPRLFLTSLIRLYQIFLSPDHSFWAKGRFPGGYCQYDPSCSEYGRQIIKKHGVIHGFPLAIWRVLRCNPWSRGGVDRP